MKKCQTTRRLCGSALSFDITGCITETRISEERLLLLSNAMMKTISKSPSHSRSAIRDRAKQMGYSIQECFAFEGCYFILDASTSVVIAGAQDFLAWDDVVRWVHEAGSAPTLQ